VRRGEGPSGYEWVKREILLCDETTTVLVKLWDDLSASTCVVQNNHIVIQNVEIEHIGDLTLTTASLSSPTQCHIKGGAPAHWRSHPYNSHTVITHPVPH